MIPWQERGFSNVTIQTRPMLDMVWQPVLDCLLLIQSRDTTRLQELLLALAFPYLGRSSAGTLPGIVAATHTVYIVRRLLLKQLS